MPGTEWPSKPAIVSSENPISAGVAAKLWRRTWIVTPDNSALQQIRARTRGSATRRPSPRSAGNTKCAASAPSSDSRTASAAAPIGRSCGPLFVSARRIHCDRRSTHSPGSARGSVRRNPVSSKHRIAASPVQASTPQRSSRGSPPLPCRSGRTASTARFVSFGMLTPTFFASALLPPRPVPVSGSTAEAPGSKFRPNCGTVWIGEFGKMHLFVEASECPGIPRHVAEDVLQTLPRPGSGVRIPSPAPDF